MNAVLRTWSVAAVVATTGCGGGGDENVSPRQTFRGGGFSFTYPAEWEQKTSPPAAGEVVGDYQVKVGPRTRTDDLISVTATEVGIRIRGRDVIVTNENIEENSGVLSIGPSMVATGLGGELGPPVKLSVGGLPALRFDASGLTVQGAGPAKARITDVFKGKKSYIITCVYAPERAAQVLQACNEVVSSFRVD